MRREWTLRARVETCDNFYYQKAPRTVVSARLRAPRVLATSAGRALMLELAVYFHMQTI